LPLPEAEHDTAFSSVIRFYGKWELVIRGTDNEGSLSFKVDHRNIMGSHTSPSSLAGEEFFNNCQFPVSQGSSIKYPG